MHDLDNAIEKYKNTNIIPKLNVLRTNTCEPENGNWLENLLTKSEYKAIIEPNHYTFKFLPAFWDTHYPSVFKSNISKVLNVITRSLGAQKGIYAAPFVYIIAIPVK